MTFKELPPDSIPHLSSIGDLTAVIAECESSIEEEIAEARSYGASWRMIGVALGTSGQGAWEKYSGHQRDTEINVLDPQLPGLSSD